MIDYIIVNEKALDSVKNLEIGEKIESDHMPLILTSNEVKEDREETEGEREGEENNWREIVSCDVEAILQYNERSEELCREVEVETSSIEEKWDKIKKIMFGAMVKKKIKKRRRKLGDKEWWDRSCTKKKREVERIYKR